MSPCRASVPVRAAGQPVAAEFGYGTTMAGSTLCSAVGFGLLPNVRDPYLP